MKSTNQNISADSFIKLFKAAVELDPSEKISLDTELRSLPLWDSLAFVGIIAELDMKLDVIVTGSQVRGCKTVGDIFSLIGNR